MRKVRLEDIFEFIRNGAQIKQFDGAGIPITRIETISNLKIDTNRLGYADIFNDDYQEYYLQNGDLLISHINSPAHLGKTAIVEQLNKKIIHGMNLLCLRANHQVIPKYIFYYFQTQPFKNALTKIMKKSVNQASISVSDLKKIEITIPSYSEQSNSVAILEQLDYQISLRQQQLQTLAQLVKSRFYEMFGDFYTTLFPKYKIGEKFELSSGSTPSRDNKLYWDSGTINWVKTTEVINKEITETEEKITKFALENTSLKLFPVNTILIAMYGQGQTRGRSAILKVESTTNQACGAIFPNKIDNPVFIWHQLMLRYNELRELGRGGNQPNLNGQLIKNFELIFPPPSLQNQFADFVAEVDKSQLACQKSLDELETLKKSLMQAYFG